MLTDHQITSNKTNTSTHSFCCSRKRAPRGKPSLEQDGTRGVVAGLPSPPMSSPPSPTRQLPNVSSLTTAADETRFHPTTSASLPSNTSASHFEAPISVPSTSGPPQSVAPEFAPATPLHPSPLPTASSESHYGGIGSLGYGSLQYSTTAPVAAGPSSARGGRKSKTHVASACINCKRAHLSCDIQRPCARCVASGKQVCEGCLF